MYVSSITLFILVIMLHLAIVLALIAAAPAQGYQCGNYISNDCQSEYNNALRNGNLGSFYHRCATEGGARPLRARCSLCCKKDEPETTTASPSTAPTVRTTYDIQDDTTPGVQRLFSLAYFKERFSLIFQKFSRQQNPPQVTTADQDGGLDHQDGCLDHQDGGLDRDGGLEIMGQAHIGQPGTILG